jgi:hypothetical protein
MSVEREGARVRHRSMTVGTGQRAEVWLEPGSNRVVLHTVHANGSGWSQWRRCSEPGCLGAAIDSSTHCLAHADDTEKTNYFPKVLSGARALTLQGVEVTEQLWNELLHSLSQERRLKLSIICSGAVFPFKIRLSDWTFEGHLGFAGALLEDGCEISRCNFMGGLGLNFVDFRNGPGYFPNCSISRGLLLDYAHCERQHVAFVDCEINGDTRAEGFVGDLRFERCRIGGAFHLPLCSWTHLSLVESTISKEINLAGSEANFIRAPGLEVATGSTLGPITVKSACDLSSTRFDSRVELKVDAKSLDLRGATFQKGGRITVERALINLERVILGATLTVVGSASAAVKSIRDADAGSLRLAYVDMSRCIFYGSHGLQDITLEPTVDLPSSPKPFRTRRRCIADEYAWRARHSRLRRNDWQIPGTRLASAEPSGDDEVVGLPELTAGEISEVYRTLRKSLENQSNEPGAADFYYGEMEMRRKDSRLSRPERFVVFLYWLTSGYGLRALRSLIFLIALTLGGAWLIQKVGFRSGGHRFADALIASAQSVVPGVSVTEPLTNWGRVTDLGLTIFGPVLIAFVVLALRNRVKR